MKNKILSAVVLVIVTLQCELNWADDVMPNTANIRVELRLAMSKNDELCHYVQKNYEYIPVGFEHIEYPGIFKDIIWQPVKNRTAYSGFKYTVLDIDNDGKTEVVFAQSSSIHNTEIQYLIIYNFDKMDFNKPITKEISDQAKGSVGLGMPQYKLKQFNEKPSATSPDMVGGFYSLDATFVEPFIYKNKTYLLFQGYIGPRWQGKSWNLIAQYNGGYFSGSGKEDDYKAINDICYFEMKKVNGDK